MAHKGGAGRRKKNRSTSSGDGGRDVAGGAATAATTRTAATTTTAAASELLNFRFASTPATTTAAVPSSSSPPRGRNYSRQQQHRPPQQRRQQQRNQATSSKKKSKDYFYLFASSDHAFVLTRCSGNAQPGSDAAATTTTANANAYTFQGPDRPVSWSHVRIVKCLVSPTIGTATAQQQQQYASLSNCPICLEDSFNWCCPRITKCGHVFCLPCLIHHVHSAAETSPYHEVKCPCCAVPLHLCDVRPVLITVTTAAAGTTTTMSFVKLHRVRHCPAPYLPRPGYPRRCAPRSCAPSQDDPDAKYCKFNYVDPDSYRELLEANARDVERQLQLQLRQQQQQQQRGGGGIGSGEEAACLGLARDFVLQEIRKAELELPRELEMIERFRNPAAGMYVAAQSPRLLSRSPQPPQHQQQQQELRRNRGNSVTSWESSCCDDVSSSTTTSTGISNNPQQQQQKRLRYGGSMYLDCQQQQQQPGGGDADGGSGETMFYQAQDGTLCFLSAFNVKCLQEEFAVSPPDPPVVHQESSESQTPETVPDGAVKPPLPDTVEGRVLDVERVHLTPAVRDRLRFLSHLPLYSDVTFVEIGIGHLLSRETKRAFAKDFSKRAQARKRLAAAEQRERNRELRQEQARVDELKERFQRIDPNDEFFQPVIPPDHDMPFPMGDEFGPVVCSSTSAAAPTTIPITAADAISTTTRLTVGEDRVLTFSQIASSGGGAVATRESDFPALGSSPPTVTSPSSSPPSPPPGRRRAPPPQPWGRPVPKIVTSQDETPATLSGPKKKSKGKKIVLFSTGGHRGGS